MEDEIIIMMIYMKCYKISEQLKLVLIAKI
jgi:hypothetical protein